MWVMGSPLSSRQALNCACAARKSFFEVPAPIATPESRKHVSTLSDRMNASQPRKRSRYWPEKPPSREPRLPSTSIRPTWSSAGQVARNLPNEPCSFAMSMTNFAFSRTLLIFCGLRTMRLSEASFSQYSAGWNRRRLGLNSRKASSKPGHFLSITSQTKPAEKTRAAKRKGGEKALESLLPKVTSQKALAKLGDDRLLAEIAKRIFSAGFVWSVIDNKWPGFEEAFLEFNPKRLLFQPAEFWEKLASDKRIVRNPQKIKSVRENAKFVTDIAAEHGSFGKFLANWPADDQAGLLDIFAKRGSRLGGFSGQYLLRFLGWDAWVLSGHVLMCLRDAGVPISANGTSKKDLRAAQAQLNAWREESGLPMAWVSRTCAMSIGENYDVARLKEIMQL